MFSGGASHAAKDVSKDAAVVVLSTSLLDRPPRQAQETEVELWGKLSARSNVGAGLDASLFADEDKENWMHTASFSDDSAASGRRNRVSENSASQESSAAPGTAATATGAAEQEERDEETWSQLHEGVCLSGLATVAIASVAVGGAHAIFVTRDGAAYGYGRNTRGQLGTGDTDPRSELCQLPALVGEFRELSPVAEDGAGAAAQMAGSIQYARVQPPAYGGRETSDSLPRPSVRYLLVAAACGAEHTLFLAKPGGRGEAAQRVFVCGAYEAIGLDGNASANSAGAASMNGDNGDGVLQADQATPQVLPCIVGVTAIAARDEASCCAAPCQEAEALPDPHLIYMWGEVCCCTCPSFFAAPTPIYRIPAPVVRVGLGGFFGLALDSHGEVYAWGDGTYGELGHAPGPIAFGRFDPQSLVSDLPVPGKIELPRQACGVDNPRDSDAPGVAGRRSFSKNQDAGRQPPGAAAPQPSVLGRAQEQVGGSSSSTGPAPRAAKDAAASGTRHPQVLDLACGERHSLLLGRDGRVFAFGDNLAGQCGVPEAPGAGHITGGTVPRPRLVPLEGPRRASGLAVRESRRQYELGAAVFAGRRHSAVVTRDRRVYLWGHPSSRKLGHAGVNPDGTVAGEDPDKVRRPPGVAVRSALRDAVRRPRLVCSLLHKRVAAMGLGDECTFIVTGEGGGVDMPDQPSALRIDSGQWSGQGVGLTSPTSASAASSAPTSVASSSDPVRYFVDLERGPGASSAQSPSSPSPTAGPLPTLSAQKAKSQAVSV